MGFVIGIIKPFLSDWMTDCRREKNKRKQNENKFKEVQQKMPELIAKMRDDFLKPENKWVKTILITRGEFEHYKNVLLYDAEKYENLFEKIEMLEKRGYIVKTKEYDVYTKEYDIEDDFIDLVIENK